MTIDIPRISEARTMGFVSFSSIVVMFVEIEAIYLLNWHYLNLSFKGEK